MKLNINLEKIMIKNNLTVEGLAESVGVNKNTISRYKRNVSEKIDLDIFARLCDTLKCEISDLLILEDDKMASAQ